jgi:hypothetical protein
MKGQSNQEATPKNPIKTKRPQHLQKILLAAPAAIF